MKLHRVRKIESVNPKENSDPIFFLEIKKDSWIPVEPFKRGKGLHQAIHENFDIPEKIDGMTSFPMTYHTRSFNIGLIENWSECKPINE